MKLRLSLLAVALVAASTTQLTHAMDEGRPHRRAVAAAPASEGSTILAGIVTGCGARLISYALKDQAGSTTQGSLVGAGLFGVAATIAWQNKNNGGFGDGLEQLVTAALVYAVTMYVIRSKSDKEVASATVTVSRPQS